jgi:hypothetical protein
MANTYTELLKLRMPALGDVGWDDEVNDNTMIEEFVLGSILKSNVIISGLAPSDGGGLDVDVTAGEVVVAGAEYSVSADTKTCTSGDKNWLFVDDAGLLQIVTSQPSGDYVAIALIDAGSTSIDRIADARNFAEGALTIGVNYSPDYYSPDTGETGAINQHLAGIDDRLGFLSGFKNQMINGRFDIWQRGISQTGNGYGSDDQYINHSAGTTKTHTREAFTIGQTDVPGNPIFFSRTVVNSVAGASNMCFKAQYLEDVRKLAGRTITVSIYARADSPRNIATEFSQRFGTGGSPSANVNGIGATKHALTTGWNKITSTVDIPSIAGKNVGTDNNHFLGLYIWFDAGSDYNSRTDTLGQQSGTFDIADIQTEVGEIATPIEKRPMEVELSLCQRYFEKTYSKDTYPGTGTSVGRVIIGMTGMASAQSQLWFIWRFNTTKRGTPTITTYDTAGNINKVNTASGNPTPTIVASTAQAEVVATDTGTTTGRFLYFQGTASSVL